jgi:GAF domain-containing protein
VTDARTLEIQARFTNGADHLDAQRLCDVCADVARMSGAGIMMMSGDIQRGSLCTTNKVSALIEELQFSLSEGPCLDAFRDQQPVLEPDLAHPRVVRWMALSEAAIEAGVAAIFGFPISIGPVKLGALNLYRDEPGGLTGEQHHDCLILAGVVARSVIMMQARATPGQLAQEFEGGADFELVVHQASGMVAAQLGVTVGQALIRMQAHAFGNGRSLRDVARAVVGRDLRFDDLVNTTAVSKGAV